MFGSLENWINVHCFALFFTFFWCHVDARELRRLWGECFGCVMHCSLLIVNSGISTIHWMFSWVDSIGPLMVWFCQIRTASFIWKRCSGSGSRENNGEDCNMMRMLTQGWVLLKWESDRRANGSDQQRYVTDLAFDYLDWPDRLKRFMIPVNGPQINKFGSKQGKKGQDGCKMDSNLMDQLTPSIHPNMT